MKLLIFIILAMIVGLIKAFLTKDDDSQNKLPSNSLKTDPDSQLEKAIRENDQLSARIAIRAGAKVNRKLNYVDDWTLIDLAISADTPSMIELLVEYGASLTYSCTITPCTITPFSHAVFNNSVQCIRTFFKLGYKPTANEMSSFKYQALDNFQIRELYDEYINDPHKFYPSENTSNNTPSFNTPKAINHNSNQPQKATKPADSQLDQAVDANNLSSAKNALQNGADPNIIHRYMDTWTMLHLAVYRKNPEMIRLLLNHGANPYVDQFNSIPPFAKAVLDCSAECIEAFLDSGYNPTPSDMIYFKDAIVANPQIKAVYNKYINKHKSSKEDSSLIDINYNAFSKTSSKDRPSSNKSNSSKSSETPKQNSSSVVDAEINTHLNDAITNNPKFNSSNKTSETQNQNSSQSIDCELNQPVSEADLALNSAVNSNNPLATLRALDRGANPNCTWLDALYANSPSIIKCLAKAGGSVNCILDGTSLLNNAIELDCIDAAKTLVKLGAIVNRETIQRVLNLKHLQLIRFLHERYAHLFPSNFDFNDVLQYKINTFDDPNQMLANALETEDLYLAEVALNKGADPDLIIDNNSMITTAVHHNSPAMISLLAQYGAKLNEPFNNASPLELAVALNATDSVQMLLQLGVKIDKNAKKVAESSNNSSITTLLQTSARSAKSQKPSSNPPKQHQDVPKQIVSQTDAAAAQSNITPSAEYISITEDNSKTNNTINLSIPAFNISDSTFNISEPELNISEPAFNISEPAIDAPSTNALPQTDSILNNNQLLNNSLSSSSDTPEITDFSNTPAFDSPSFDQDIQNEPIQPSLDASSQMDAFLNSFNTNIPDLTHDFSESNNKTEPSSPNDAPDSFQNFISQPLTFDAFTQPAPQLPVSSFESSFTHPTPELPSSSFSQSESFSQPESDNSSAFGSSFSFDSPLSFDSSSSSLNFTESSSPFSLNDAFASNSSQKTEDLFQSYDSPLFDQNKDEHPSDSSNSLLNW